MRRVCILPVDLLYGRLPIHERFVDTLIATSL